MFGKIYVVTDLGSGDGGKGGVVHKIANTFHAQAVLKFGGGQGSHGVVADTGEKFAFSHWGCATLEGIRTIMAPTFVAIPHAILNEGESLKKMGLRDPYALLKVDPNVLCALPIHRVASQLNELLRKDHPRGTVGTGVGVAYRCYQYSKHYHVATMNNIFMCDLHGDQNALVEKLGAVAVETRMSFAKVQLETDFLPEDQPLAEELLDLLYDSEYYIDWTLAEYQKLVKTSMELVDFGEALRRCDGVAVAECSHGVLTDAQFGFAPHTSALRTVPKLVRETLREAGFDGKFVNLGVTRAYAIRHGAGPLPTEDGEMRETLLPDSHKQTNRWQGEVRVGALDFVLLKKAIDICGGPEKFDGLCVTWLDQIIENGVWQFCHQYLSYPKVLILNYSFLSVDAASVMGVEIESVTPQILQQHLSYWTEQETIDFCCRLFEAELSVPVRMVSLGPDDQHKILL